jgi:DNA-binding protein Fis
MRLGRQHVLAALAILFVLFTPYQTLVQTVITDDAVRLRIEADEYDMTWVTVAYGVGVLYGVFAGLSLSARIGRRYTLVLAMLVFSAGNVLCGAATGLISLAVARFVEGFGKMLAMAVGRVTLYKQFDHALLVAIGFYGVFAYSTRRYGRELGREVIDVAPETIERLRSHAWPGNIRELQNVMKQALLRASGTVLLPAFLPEPLGDLGGPSQSSLPAREELDLEGFIRARLSPDASDLYSETHREVDRLLLTQVLEYTEGNQHRAARLLGIARQTLRLKLRDLGLHVTRSVESDEEDEA